MELNDTLKTMLIEAARSLKGVPAGCLWPVRSKNWDMVDNSVPHATTENAGLLSAESRQVPTPKVPQTDAIFAQVAAINQAADGSETVLRLSLDAKATVKVGPFARWQKTHPDSSN